MNLLLESILKTTSDFRLKIEKMAKGKSKVAKMASLLNDFLSDEEDFDDLLYNYIDVTDKNDIVTFFPDSKIVDEYDEKYFTKKGRSEIKIGRLIRHLFDMTTFRCYTTKELNSYADINITDKDYEDFVNAYKATEIDSRKFELVSGDDIPTFYKKGNESGTLGSSCMKDEPKNLFKLYKNNDNVKLLVLVNDEGKMTGRALIWKLHDSEFHYFMDRVYTSYDYDLNKFIEYAQKNDIAYKEYMNSRIENAVYFIYNDKKIKTKIQVKLDKWVYYTYPYLDTLMFLDEERGILSNTPTIGCYKLQSLHERYLCDNCRGKLIIAKTRPCPSCATGLREITKLEGKELVDYIKKNC